MEARHHLQVEALRLFFESRDITILREIRRKDSYTFFTNSKGFTPHELKNLTNFAKVGVSLWVKNDEWMLAVNVCFI